MRIIARRALVEFYKVHSDAKTALEEWYKKVKNAKWTCFADVKRSFRSVDSVGNGRFVFNIKGNDYRLVVLILFLTGMVYVRFVGTHSDYSSIKGINSI